MPVYLLGEATVSTGFLVIAIIALVLQSIILLVAFFGRSPRYRITSPQPGSLDSSHFLYMLEALTDAKINRRTGLQVFTNGDNFYEAELQAIREAQKSINLEAYIFQKSQIAQRFVEEMTGRAAAGVKVNVVLDALGSVGTSDSYFSQLRAAGGKVSWYNSARFSKLPRFNNRSHREVLVLDGKVAFIGGAGIADQWFLDKKNKPRWRDTMVRVEGDAVPNLQATFCENWLESRGEVLTGEEYFPIYEMDTDSAVLIINSTPSAGGATRARILFQLLLASARQSIHITTPYFLPDRSLLEELIRARQRDVDVKIVTPGSRTDHLLTRSSSRHSYGSLLLAGVRIFEYRPAMIHAKILMVDGCWGVVGSTNFDNRSFGINDEVNLAAFSREFTDRLEQDFIRDIANSREITYEKWRKRSLFERGPELLGWITERQQ
jgi:cardiolipin synthase